MVKRSKRSKKTEIAEPPKQSTMSAYIVAQINDVDHSINEAKRVDVPNNPFQKTINENRVWLKNHAINMQEIQSYLEDVANKLKDTQYQTLEEYEQATSEEARVLLDKSLRRCIEIISLMLESSVSRHVARIGKTIGEVDAPASTPSEIQISLVTLQQSLKEFRTPQLSRSATQMEL